MVNDNDNDDTTPIRLRDAVRTHIPSARNPGALTAALHDLAMAARANVYLGAPPTLPVRREMRQIYHGLVLKVCRAIENEIKNATSAARLPLNSEPLDTPHDT